MFVVQLIKRIPYSLLLLTLPLSLLLAEITSGSAPITAPINSTGRLTASLTNELSRERTQFLQAETALSQGQLLVYQKLKEKLKNYPLYPYLIYNEFDRKIQTLSLNDFQSFMKNYPDSPLAEQLRQHWLQTKAKQEDWKSFLAAYIPTDDVSLQCHFYWAELHHQKHKIAVLEQLQPLWLTGKETPKACEAVFKIFENSPAMTRALVWQRIKAAVQNGNERIARSMIKYIKKSEVALVELWILIHNNPSLVTQKKFFSSQHPAYLEMIVHGVSLIATTKPETAIQIWQQIGRQYAFTERHWGLVVRAIGLAFAKQRHPEAEKWLSKVPNIYANTEVHEWRIRVALAKEDWPTVLHWYTQLPKELAENEAWGYWHARALEKVNRIKESQAILAKLSQTRSYYGFLASQHLQKPYSIVNQKFIVDNSTMANISRKGAVLRARELYLLNRESKARSEWLTSTQKMNDTERHAAAALALRWGLPNWSILALSKANNKNDLSLRFPIVYNQPIMHEARKNQLDPALIFAVTRQESAFVTNARSSSGAIGLMQLLPSTASWLAKKYQIFFRGTHTLMEPHTNIQIGSRYLRMLLDDYKNHPILATAAYNAGPGRVKKWMPTYDMSPDAWVETIPFKETREYVKNVMTNMVIYQQMLGSKPKQTISLAYIPAKEKEDLLVNSKKLANKSLNTHNTNNTNNTNSLRSLSSLSSLKNSKNSNPLKPSFKKLNVKNEKMKIGNMNMIKKPNTKKEKVIKMGALSSKTKKTR